MATTKARKYKKVSCHTTKSAANKAKKALHNKGMTARGGLSKNADGKYCIESAGKRKTVRLHTGQVLSGTKRRKKRTTRK